MLLALSALGECARAHVCVVKRLWSVWLWGSVTFFFSPLISFLSLSYLVSPVSISSHNRCLYSLWALKRSQTACCRKQVWNEKGQITRGWWSWGGKEWKKRERLVQITKEGEREETAENNIIRRERWQGERKRGGEGARGRVPIKLMTSTSKPSTDCSWYTNALVLVTWENTAMTCINFMEINKSNKFNQKPRVTVKCEPFACPFSPQCDFVIILCSNKVINWSMHTTNGWKAPRNKSLRPNSSSSQSYFTLLR